MPEFKYNICRAFCCTPELCRKAVKRECGSKYWEKACMNYGEHLILNENKSEFFPSHLSTHKADRVWEGKITIKGRFKG